MNGGTELTEHAITRDVTRDCLVGAPQPDVIPGLPNGHPMYYALVREMVAISERKRTDYGGTDPLGNLRRSGRLGVPPWRAVLIRMTDKFSRVENIASDPNSAAVTDESIEDTLLDIANYAILCLVAKRALEDDGADRERPLSASPGAIWQVAA